MERDWREWHREYDDPESRLSRRLRVVQGYVRDALDRCAPGPIRVVSACAGEGRDLLAVLEDHPRAGDVTGRLLELDPDLAATAAARTPAGIEVVCGDASNTSAYDGAVPADVVLLCGIFGNISDTDIEHTVRLAPTLCAPGASVIWTRHRLPPDRTVDIRRWFGAAGFAERGFHGADDQLFAVGVHQLVVAPQPFEPGIELFRFVGYGVV